jgi:hypothetical protein
MNGPLATTRAMSPFGEAPRRNRPPKPLPRRQSFLLEPLESRLLLSVSAEFVGPVSLSVGPIVNVSQLANNQQEVTIAVNPSAPGNLIAASNDAVSGNTNDIVWTSIDGGLNWTQVAIPSAGGGAGGDPTVVFNSTGTAVYSHLSGGIAAAVSTDGGFNWTAVNVDAGAGRDKEFLAVGPDRLNPGQERFYLAWDRNDLGNVIFTSSSADGINWSTPVQVDPGGNRIDTHMAVGGDGTVYLFFQDTSTADQSDIMFSSSIDDGANWSVPVNIHTTQINPFNSTFSGGRYDIPAQPDRGTWPSLSVDIDRSGGPFDGRLYVSFTDSPGDSPALDHNNTNVFVMTSDDGGDNWSTPVMVNDDGGTNSQFMSWLAVDQNTGALSVSWYDARNDDGTAGRKAGANNDVQYWGTLSLDGGTTWLPNLPITTAFSDENAAEPFDAGFFDLDYGDYTGNAFFGGVFHPVWTDNSNSTADNPDGATKNDIYTAAVTVSGNMVINIFGDSDFINEDDTFIIVLDQTGDFIQVWENNTAMLGTPDFTAALAAVTQINVFGFGGNDTLIVDSSNGLISVANGIRYDGDGGVDGLQLLQTGGSPVGISDTYSVGPAIGSGKSVIEGSTETQTVFFEDLSPVLDLVPAASLTVNATAADNAINYMAGAQGGLVTVDNFESIEFKNKTNLTINGLAGNDTINLHYNNTVNPAGLTTITVNGADSTGVGDTLIVNGIDGVLDNLRYTPTAVGAGTVVNDSQPQPPVNFTGIEHLTEVIQQADGDGVRIEGTIGNDAIEFFHGLTSDSGLFVGTMDQNNVTGVGPFTMTPVNFTGASPVANDTDVNFFNPGGTDSFAFNGTTNDDTIAVGTGEGGGTEFRNTVNGIVVSRMEVFNVASFLVRALAGNDIINVTLPTLPAAVTLRVEGGDGSDRVNLNLVGTAGDDDIIVNGSDISLGTKTIETNGIENIRLDLLGNGSDRIIYNGVSGITENITVSGSGIAGSGKISVPGVTLIDFSNVERILVNGNAPTPNETDTLTFAGTNAADTFNINLAAVGTISDPVLKLQKNGTTTLLTLENYTNFNTLRVQGLDGSDTFNVLTAASTTPPDLNFQGRNLFVDGGQPTGKKKLTDNLNVFYTAPRPKIIQSAATQDPDAGLVDLDYGTARFVVNYDDVEQVRVLRK